MGLLLLTFASIRSSFCPCRFSAPRAVPRVLFRNQSPTPAIPTWLIGLTYYTTFPWIMVAPCAKKAKNTLPQYGVIISFLALFFNRFLTLFPFSSVFYNLVKFSHFVRILLSHRTCAKLGGLGQCQQSFGILGFKGGDTTLQKCGKLRRIGWCIRRQAAAHQRR